MSSLQASTGTAAAPATAVPTVRASSPADVVRLAELYAAAQLELGPMRGGRALLGSQGRPAPVTGSFLEQIADPARALVTGLVGEEVVGYGSCRTFVLSGPGGERLGAMDELYVMPEYRRQGVGRALAAALLDWCRTRGCSGVDGSALPGSRAVKSFFESEGFTARLLVMHRPLT